MHHQHCPSSSKKIEWCVYAVFIRDHKLINTHCLVDSHANLTSNLDRYIRVISSLATGCIQVSCLEETHLETIVPPLTHIFVGNDCEGCSTNMYIPSKSDLTSEIDTSIRCEILVVFNTIYQNIAQYNIWYELQLETLTTKKKNLFGIKLSEFPLMALNNLSDRIHQIGMDYPWSVPHNTV